MNEGIGIADKLLYLKLIFICSPHSILMMIIIFTLISINLMGYGRKKENEEN